MNTKLDFINGNTKKMFAGNDTTYDCSHVFKYGL